MKLPNLVLVLGVSLFTAGSAVLADDLSREKILLDAGWKFHLGDDWGPGENLMKAGISIGPADPTFCDVFMRPVNLPHDWVVELPFDPKSDKSHGYKPVGPKFPENSTGWYRKTFTLPKTDAGRRLWLDFDGVFRNATVFLNGYRVGRHESGYSSFRFDITDAANCGGENILAVRVDASEFEGWFYEGAGIYRHVWLEKTSPLAIAPDGIFVYSQFPNNVPEGPAEIHIKTKLLDSQSLPANATVHYEIIGPEGQSVASQDSAATVPPWLKIEVKSTNSIPQPELWSPESPKLYKLITIVASGGQMVDREETEFGIRTFAFDADKGFFLNGKPYVIKGTCNHQDHAGVGSAMPDALQYFRIAKLKEMGDNAYRTSHNPPTPELLAACDRLGMLVMDENRLLGSSEENLDLLEGLIQRDRNHACVFLWSIANEEHVQAAPASARMAETMQRLIRQFDPTRPVTCAVSLGDVWDGIDSAIEVRGWNYHLGADVDDYHQKHPSQPEVGTEQASTVTTRGIYTNDAAHGYVAAYDGQPKAGQSASDWWMFFDHRPWLSGGFAWTGFDYRGEPTPYNWPCISSHFGILDTCGFPKDNFYFYQSWWSDKIVLHLLPHWNWPGREGQDIEVRALSNCQEVELFLNGQSLGKKKMIRDSSLKWLVKYASGILSAKGYNEGKLVGETRVETTGAPAAVQLTPDRTTITADGRDLSLVTVSVTDAKGNTVPVAGNLIHFTVNGPGKIIGVGNGDPSCHEPDVYLGQPASRSGTINEWWMKKVSAKHSEPPVEVAEKANDTRWYLTDLTHESGLFNAGESAAFRAHFYVSDQDLARTSIPVRFKAIRDEGWVYVNGKPAGESHDPTASPVFDVRPFLHSGVNTIAVLVRSHGKEGGLGNGVSVTLPDEPVTAHWQRSVFNGLAQVIVQSDQSAGDIKLEAKADGLSGTLVIIHTTTAAAHL